MCKLSLWPNNEEERRNSISRVKSNLNQTVIGLHDTDVDQVKTAPVKPYKAHFITLKDNFRT